MKLLNCREYISRSDCSFSMIEYEQWPRNKIDSKSMPLGMLDHRKELNAGSQLQRLCALCVSVVNTREQNHRRQNPRGLQPFAKRKDNLSALVCECLPAIGK